MVFLKTTGSLSALTPADWRLPGSGNLKRALHPSLVKIVFCFHSSSHTLGSWPLEGFNYSNLDRQAEWATAFSPGHPEKRERWGHRCRCVSHPPCSDAVAPECCEQEPVVLCLLWSQHTYHDLWHWPLSSVIMLPIVLCDWLQRCRFSPPLLFLLVDPIIFLEATLWKTKRVL